MIDKREPLPVEAGRHVGLADGKPHGIRDPLAQGARGDFDPVVPPLGVPGREAVPLAELLDLGKRQFIARQVQQRIEKHGAVPARQDKAVAVGPAGVCRVEAQVPRPQDVGHRGRAQRQARVARFRLLDGVDGEHADGVDAKGVGLTHLDDLLLVCDSGLSPCAAAPRRAVFGFVMTWRGIRCDEIPHSSLAEERLHEMRFFQKWENPRRYPSPEVDSSRGQDLEGHVARLGPQDGGEKVKRPDTDITGSFPVKRFFDDHRDGVGLAAQPLGEPGRFSGNPAFLQEIVDVHDPDSRADPLIAHVAVEAAQGCQQIILELRRRRKVGVPSLGGKGPVVLAVPGEPGLAQARPGGDHGLGAVAHGLPFPKGDEILLAKEGDKGGDGLHVVDHPHGPHLQGLPQAGLVDRPGEVRDPGLSLEHRPGNAEDGLRCAPARLVAGNG